MTEPTNTPRSQSGRKGRRNPVKRRPPTARRVYFTELAVPSVYIFLTSNVLSIVANAPLIAGYRRYPPCHFASSPSATPTAPLGSAFLVSPGTTSFMSISTNPNELAHTLLSNRLGADDDADDDV